MGVAIYVWHLVYLLWLGVGVIWLVPSVTFYPSIKIIAHLIILPMPIVEHLTAEAVSA